LQDMHHICSTLPNPAHELYVGTVPKMRHFVGKLGHIFTLAVPADDRQIPTCRHSPHICTNAITNTSYTTAATPQSI
jgi:hypothetical protein